MTDAECQATEVPAAEEMDLPVPSTDSACSVDTDSASTAKDVEDLADIVVNTAAEPESECTDEDASANKKRKHNKRREDQFVNQVVKSVSHIQDPTEQIKFIARKLHMATEETKQSVSSCKTYEKRLLQLTRENEQSSADLSKAIFARTRLESLCRELQRQHKALKEEMALRSREDEEKRKEVTIGFQTKLTEITSMIEDNHARNDKLKDQNAEIRDRLNEVVNRYALREEEVKKLLKTAEEQATLSEARIANAEKEMIQCKLIYLKDKETWTALEMEYKKQVALLEQSEARLKAEVAIYSDKYQSFQDAFKNFQTEMTNMSKKIGALEKESTVWRQRCERNASSLIKMAGEKEATDAKLEAAKRSALRFETLSRALMEDRSELRKRVQDTNGDVDVGQDQWSAFLEASLLRLKLCEESLGLSGIDTPTTPSAAVSVVSSEENSPMDAQPEVVTDTPAESAEESLAQ